ncbi:hypothetical protein Leryth_018109 [Lithospermum erythrorhizon]|nr:hypothetical protein Leryth_018109 [Lithospermum erythrorhizon]
MIRWNWEINGLQSSRNDVRSDWIAAITISISSLIKTFQSTLKHIFISAKFYHTKVDKYNHKITY